MSLQGIQEEQNSFFYGTEPTGKACWVGGLQDKKAVGQNLLKVDFCTWGLRKEGRKGRKTDLLALDSSPVLKGPWQTGPFSGDNHTLELRLLGEG